MKGRIKDLITKYRHIPGILLLLATIVIFAGTLFPSKPSLSINIWDYDKIGHFLMFGGWTFLYGIFRAFKLKQRPNLTYVFILGSTYGLLIEFLQFVFPTNRSPEMMDFIADMIGALAAIGVLHFIFKRIFVTDEDSLT